jgi:hypothetical protein
LTSMATTNQFVDHGPANNPIALAWSAHRLTA